MQPDGAGKEPRFAHPLEHAFARVLDGHGIAWQYEPHMLVLERDASGNVREAIQPDFYLPEQDMYIECTAMRQPLTRRKRNKVRKARRLHGAVIEVLYSKDALRLSARWGLPELARAVLGPR